MPRIEGGRGDLFVTSRHRASPVFEWSKQLSRDTHPYFVADPTPSAGAGILGDVAPVLRHLQSPLAMDKALGRDTRPPAKDTRDYNPVRHEELHRRCATDIGRCAPRSGSPKAESPSNASNARASRGRRSRIISAQEAAEMIERGEDPGAQSPAEGNPGEPEVSEESPRPPQYDGLDPFKYPGWGKNGNHSSMARAPRSYPDGSPTGSAGYARDRGAGQAGGAASAGVDGRNRNQQRRSQQHDVDVEDPKARRRRLLTGDGGPPLYTESRIRRPPGGKFSEGKDRRPPPPPVDLEGLAINLDSIRPHKPVVALARYKGREGNGEGKPSSKYLQMLFRLPPAAPLSVPDKKTFGRGFAPQRWTFRNDVSSLLAISDADRRRAHSSMDQLFRRDRSELRTQLMYTPAPRADSPTATDG